MVRVPSTMVAALKEFADMISTIARDVLQHRFLEAQDDYHRLEVCMAIQSHICSKEQVTMQRIYKWFNVYPEAADMCEVDGLY